MKFLLLTFLDEEAWRNLGEAEQQRIMAVAMPHLDQLIASGRFLGGAQLEHTSEAVTVRLRDRKPLVTDGPFAEAREQVAGYTIIEARDRDEAIAIAKSFLGTRSLASIEIRAVLEAEGFRTH